MGLFNFKGDEAYRAFKIFQEFVEEEEVDEELDDEYEWRRYCEDGSEYGLYPDDYETKEEYKAALREAKYGWRDICEDMSVYGIDPYDYETEEEYEEARHAWRDTCEDGMEYDVDPYDYEFEEEYMEALEEAKEAMSNMEITLNISVEWPRPDEREEIREEDYPNKRRYDAADTLTRDYIVNSSEEYAKEQTARCRFITDKGDTILAADYLTPYGDFLYSQAIKDNFKLPCSLPEEDERREMDFSEIICKIAKRDISLAFAIWAWCLEQFLPYAEYDDYCSNDLGTAVFEMLCDFPEGYEEKLVHYMGENEQFLDGFLCAGVEPGGRVTDLIAKAVKEEQTQVSDILFKACLKKSGEDWKRVHTLIHNLFYSCSNYKESEAMKYFREHLFPQVKEISIGMVQDEIPEWEERISKYLNDMEKKSQRYVYTQNKVGLTHSQPGEHSVKMEEYEKDTTIYTYCGVLLSHSTRPYFFRTEDVSIKIGDEVIVPVGSDKREAKGKVVSVGQYARIGVPFPVEQTKMILRKT